MKLNLGKKIWAGLFFYKGSPLEAFLDKNLYLNILRYHLITDVRNF